MTLVEILVVLAVLAALTAVAIPGFMRMGLFSRNDLLSSARELHALLNAAKIYAVTYRVPTGVVYDSPVAGETGNMFHAAAMVFKHPYPDRVDSRFKSTDEVFMPVPGDQGHFRVFSGAACLVDPRENMNEPAPDIIPNRGGMTFVTVFFPDNRDDPINRYANVFEPSGRLRQGQDDSQRYELALGYDPTETDDTERLDQNGDIRTVKIEIYRSTGRVQIVKGEGDV